MALADPFQILLILGVIPITILAVLLWLVYNHGKRVGRLETRASETKQA
jgi:hypothetical protein